MPRLKPKSPRDSFVETRYILMPQDANQLGTAFGGTIVSWIDMTASMVAARHCGTIVVTAEIDSLTFHAPVYIGEQVVLKASVNYVGRTSMEIGVQVTKENPKTGEKVKTTSAYLTFVSLGKNKKPIPVPPLILETAEEKRRYENAKIRVQARRELIARMKKRESKF